MEHLLFSQHCFIIAARMAITKLSEMEEEEEAAEEKQDEWHVAGWGRAGGELEGGEEGGRRR